MRALLGAIVWGVWESKGRFVELLYVADSLVVLRGSPAGAVANTRLLQVGGSPGENMEKMGFHDRSREASRRFQRVPANTERHS